MSKGRRDSCQTRNKSLTSTQTTELKNMHAQMDQLEKQNQQLIEEMNEVKKKKA